MNDRAAVSRHVAVVVHAPAAAVLTVAADPARLSDWAAGLAESPLHRDGDDWVADAPFGRVTVRFAPSNPYGVLDHVVTMPDGTEVLNPLRVLPWDDARSEVVFTVRQRDGMTDAQFDDDVAAVAADLAALAAMVERESAPPGSAQ